MTHFFSRTVFPTLLAAALQALSLTAPGAAQAAAPAPLFEVSASGDEVTDLRTGLIWRRCAEGQVWTGTTCSGGNSGFNWWEGLNHAASVAASTGKAWRLPDPKEAISLVPLLALPDSAAFPGANVGQYWTGTAHIETTHLIWYADLPGGAALLTGSQERVGVRLVRAAP